MTARAGVQTADAHRGRRRSPGQRRKELAWGFLITASIRWPLTWSAPLHGVTGAKRGATLGATTITGCGDAHDPGRCAESVRDTPNAEPRRCRVPTAGWR